MSDSSAEKVVRSAYEAYATGDRELMESAAAPGYTFSSPDDPALDREAYFERCWANHEHIGGFEIEQLLEEDGGVLVRYVATRADGSRFRNVEYHLVEDGRIVRTEVYYGTEVQD
jgi:ketosteroid isomerase-like protein